MAALITADWILAVTSLQEQCLFFIFPPCFSNPLLSPSPNSRTPVPLPATPQDLQALPMRALLWHSFPETRTSRSAAILPSSCHPAPYQSDAQHLMIPHYRPTQLAKSRMWVLYGCYCWACLVKPSTQRKTNAPCFSKWLKRKSCKLRGGYGQHWFAALTNGSSLMLE